MTANLWKNLLTSICIAEKDEVVSGGGPSRTNKNLSKFKKQKISTVSSNVGANAKTKRFLTFEASTAFI